MINKKGAMFGLESRALKKQFGELFLVRMQREAPQGANGARIQSNRGAMFGLDARIALAIFGALSVISGAALYSAIQKSEISRKITQASEIEKAVTQYILDTGTMLPFSKLEPLSDLSIGALVEKPTGVSNWKGPYINIKKYASYDYLDNNGELFALSYTTTAPFPESESLCKKSSPNCAVYVVVLSNNEHNNALEEKLDGNKVADRDGNFRVIWGHQYFKSSIPFDKSTSPNT